jgi:hypothetical protein
MIEAAGFEAELNRTAQGVYDLDHEATREGIGSEE